MPTIFTLHGYRFMFYSNDHEPIHVHVTRGSSRAKYNLFPSVALVYNIGIKTSELRQIEEAIREHKEQIIEYWLAHFNNGRKYEKD